ncbi:UNVERIFIED_CONTAM: hypothetical protein GTU68_012987, partial [Idotea baltica]|nr:hypothetical protein [Idotea baltica]
FISFLIGSIPVGYLLANFSGVDIRSKGSGNTGATNVARVLGRRLGIVTLIADVLKGSLGSALLYFLAGTDVSTASLATHGFAAMLGHCYSPFIGFRGGKGVATSLGVLIVAAPTSSLIVLGTFAIVFKLSRYVSLASISAALSFPLSIWATAGGKPDLTVFFISIMFALVIVIRHEKNIQRLRNGEERRFSST